MRTINSLAVLLIIVFISINAEDKNFGKELTLTEKTSVAQIMDNPADYEGKKVLIEGTVVSVCEMRGCWIEVAAKEGYEKIRVKVDDGVIVFPMEAKGKKAVVEGEVYAVNPAHDCSGDCSEKTAEEKEDCEHESAKVYQIKGEGAVISM